MKNEKKEILKEATLNNLKLRIDLYKESNNKMIDDLNDKESKLKHKIRENVIMKNGFEMLVESENTPSEIKKFCQDILSNVEKFKKE